MTNFASWDWGDEPNAQTYHDLLKEDGLAKFRCFRMTTDALSNWLPNAPVEWKERIKELLVWSQGYGTAYVHLLDTQEDQETPFSGKAVDFEVFHPMAGGYGVKDPDDADLDERGSPTKFRVVRSPMGVETVIDASRMIVFPYEKITRTWYGISALRPVINEIIFYRRWTQAFGVRAEKVAVPTYEGHKTTGTVQSDGNIGWPTTEMDYAKGIFGDKNVMFSLGEVEWRVISPNLQPAEIEIIKDAFIERMASAWGVSKSVIKGADEGHLASSQTNLVGYNSELRNIQQHYSPYMQSLFETFGLEWEGWNDPWEESEQVQVQSMLNMANAYNTLASSGTTRGEEIANIIADRLVENYGTGG